MKKVNAIIICSLAVIFLLFVSCGKEPVTNSRPPRSSTNLPNSPNPPSPPIVVTPNGNPVDSLTGKEFIFNNLSWTLDDTYLVCVVNRPDLFYLVDRPLDVSISISGSPWMKVLMCPYPTDPFFYESWPAGILKVYLYNYTSPLLDSTTSVKVRF